MKKHILLLTLILLLGFVFRLYRISNPIADWHSWRQADTSAVSRYYVQNGIDLLHPKFEDLSNIPSGKENPEGYRFVEFPLYNAVVALLTMIFSFWSVEIWGRIVTIFASVSSIWLLYQVIKNHLGEKRGLLAALFFAFVPYNIYYGRTILPDVSAVAASLASLYFFDRYLFKKKQRIFLLVISCGFLAIAFLLKPYILFFTLPFIALAYKKYGFTMFTNWKLYIYVLVSVIPLILWRNWIQQYPEGIPVSDWLFNGNGIRFKPAFFRWILYERITKLISGYVGVLLLGAGVVGVIKEKLKDQLLVGAFALSSIVYVCTLATGNVQHDYYQIYIIPTLAIFYGIGADYFLHTLARYIPKNLSYPTLGILTLLMFYFAGNQIKDYFNINNPNIVIAGKEADHILPKNAKVIALYDGDTSFLYHTNRSGWPALEHDISDMIKLGATHMVLVNPTENDFNGFGKQYPVVASSSAYLILKLQ